MELEANQASASFSRSSKPPLRVGWGGAKSRNPTKKYMSLTKYKMISVSGHDYKLSGYTGLGTTWINETNIGMNHAPGAGSIT